MEENHCVNHKKLKKRLLLKAQQSLMNICNLISWFQTYLEWQDSALLSMKYLKVQKAGDIEDWKILNRFELSKEIIISYNPPISVWLYCIFLYLQELYIVPLAWVNTTVYDFKNQMNTATTLYMWTYAEDIQTDDLLHPLGTVVSNPSGSHATQLTLAFKK